MRTMIIGIIALSLTVVSCGKKDDTTAGKAPAAAPTAAAEAAKQAGETAKQAGQAAAAQAEEAAGAAAKAAEGAAAQAEGAAKKVEAAAKAELAKVAPVVDGAQALAKEGEPLTLAEYEKLMLALASCSVGSGGIDRKCPAFVEFNERRKTRGTALKGLSGALAGLGRKHVGHENPAVRLQASSLMASLFGADASSQTALVEAAQKEQHPVVLKSMLRSVGSSIGKNPAVRALVLDKATHEDEAVRIEASVWLTSSFADGTEGTLEKALEMIESDASPKVQKLVCRNLGKRADERALPTLEAHTKDASDPLYDSCFQGVIGMWAGPVAHEKPSEKAYRMTLALLGAKPRTEKQPPWNAISGLQWAKKPDFQKAAPWFDNGALLAALEDIVVDRETNWLARTGAVDTMLKLGAPKATFEKLAAAYADSKGTDSQVAKKIGEAASKAK